MRLRQQLQLGLAAVLGIAVAIVTVDRGALAAASGPDAGRVAKGFKISPVPLSLKGLDRDTVGLGSYLVNATGGCNDCHTNPPYAKGGDPYAGQPIKVNAAGYLAGGQHFGPDLVSPNLTPDEKGLPGGMTYKKFFAAMRFGQDPDDPKAILQVMPWPVYSHMTDSDLRAIYEYLRAIPSIKTAEE